TRLGWVEVALAFAALATLCAAVLSVAPQTAEPDDGAYHASIVAITDGHFLTLSTAQAETLARELRDNPAAPPNQWVEVTPGRWISEKAPGYPFLAAPFEKLGIIRLAPLFYGLLACLGLFVAARRWLRLLRLGAGGRACRCSALARALRRAGGGWSVLLLRCRPGLRLARLHADVHRRLAHRGRNRRRAVGSARNRREFAGAQVGGPRRLRGAR